MLFRKKIEKACFYCAHSAKIDEESCLCVRKGIVESCAHCRKFKYEPLKRIPARRKATDFSEFDSADFSL